MRCGVDTERSTPQFSLNSHSFFGWFTRATTRGTAELLLGEQRDHEVVLVVAGRGDDDVAALEPGLRAATLTSHASATSHSTPSAGLGARSTTVGFCSMSSTSWPALARSLAMNEPDVAGAGDRDPHQCVASRARCAPAASSSADHVGDEVRARRLPGRSRRW